MEKRIYVLPQTEVTNLGVLSRLMSELGIASLPSQPAPERQPKAF